MITLSDGIVTLTLYHLIWRNRVRDKAAGSERATFGRLVVQRLAISAGQEIVLESVADGEKYRGWFLWSQVSQLEAWRDAGTPLTLNYEGEIRHGVITLGGVNIRQVIEHSKTPGATEIGTGTLTIKES